MYYCIVLLITFGFYFWVINITMNILCMTFVAYIPFCWAYT